MKTNSGATGGDEQIEIEALLVRLNQTRRRLHELTDGKSDEFRLPVDQPRQLLEAEVKLHDSEERFRGLFSAAAIGIAVAAPDGRYMEANAAYCRMVGYTEEELRQLTFAALTHPDDLALNRQLRAEVIAGSRENFLLEKRYIKKGGDVLWVRVSVSPTYARGGEITTLVVIAEDITERKRIDARFRRLVDSNVQGVFFWNTNGQTTDANDAFLKMIGYTREDLEAGRISWAEMTPPEFREQDERALKELAASGVCEPFEKEFIRQDGSRVPVILGPATFEDDRREGVCFALDLSERKKLEQQFLRAQRMESIGTLAGGVAHDLNNILSPIMLSIYLLKEDCNSTQTREILDTIEACARRGADIVRQVLFFARGLDGQRIEIQPQVLLRELENIVKDTFPKNIQMAFSVPDDVWAVSGDPTQIHQILMNLCVNARDAMPHGGRLIITAKNRRLDEHYVGMNVQAKAGRYVNISVTDSGVGMPRNVIDRIFEPFFTTKDLNKGTGLGLSTALAIVKNHAGIINVYSEPGKGTTFDVYLPATEDSSAPTASPGREAMLARGNGETILVVDDESAILTITRQTLEAHGYRVLVAEDGAEAVATYAEKKNEIAVVLTDMMMPTMDGANLIRILRRINPATKIVGSSGLFLDSNADRAAEVGVKHFLTKPYTAETLLMTMRAILDDI